MKLKAICCLFFTVLLFSFSVAAQEDKCPASKDLPNLGCVNENLYRGAQPTEKGIGELAQRGVKTIVYLRGDDEKATIEETWAHNAGIKFINVPLSNWFAPKDSQIKRILSLLNAPDNQPIFVHCQRGADRTGTVIAVYRIAHDGWTAKRAKAEAKTFHIGWWQIWMKRYIGDYYQSHEKPKVKTNV